jgi:hypothetical protein
VVNGSIHDSDPKTYMFTLDGEAMEIDLCDKHRAMFTKDMLPFTVNARSAAPRATTGLGSTAEAMLQRVNAVSAPARRRGRPLGSKNGMRQAKPMSEAQRIRAWAKGSGFKLSERGRIPSNVTTAYHEATVVSALSA